MAFSNLRDAAKHVFSATKRNSEFPKFLADMAELGMILETIQREPSGLLNGPEILARTTIKVDKGSFTTYLRR